MPDAPRLRLLPGRTIVNGIPTDCVLDHDAGEVVIANAADPRQLAQTAFNAGREWERDLPIEDLGDMAIDGPLGQSPDE